MPVREKHDYAQQTDAALNNMLTVDAAGPEHIIAAKQAGVNKYIVKPVNALTLKQKLVAVLGQF